MKANPKKNEELRLNDRAHKAGYETRKRIYRFIRSEGIFRSVDRDAEELSHSASKGGTGGAFLRREICVSSRRFAAGVCARGGRSSDDFVEGFIPASAPRTSCHANTPRIGLSKPYNPPQLCGTGASISETQVKMGTRIFPGSSHFCMDWIEIQSFTMKVDRGPKVLDVPEATAGFLDPLDRRVDAVQSRMGDAMLQSGEHWE